MPPKGHEAPTPPFLSQLHIFKKTGLANSIRPNALTRTVRHEKSSHKQGNSIAHSMAGGSSERRTNPVNAMDGIPPTGEAVRVLKVFARSNLNHGQNFAS